MEKLTEKLLDGINYYRDKMYFNDCIHMDTTVNVTVSVSYPTGAIIIYDNFLDDEDPIKNMY